MDVGDGGEVWRNEAFPASRPTEWQTHTVVTQRWMVKKTKQLPMFLANLVFWHPFFTLDPNAFGFHSTFQRSVFSPRCFCDHTLERQTKNVPWNQPSDTLFGRKNSSVADETTSKKGALATPRERWKKMIFFEFFSGRNTSLASSTQISIDLTWKKVP